MSLWLDDPALDAIQRWRDMSDHYPSIICDFAGL